MAHPAPGTPPDHPADTPAEHTPAAWHSPTANDDGVADYATLIRRGWEMELIISGFLTFALLQVPQLVDRLTTYIFIEGFTLLSPNNDLLALLVVKGLSLILAGHLVFHIVVRAVWVAFIGLQISFPGGARIEPLRLLPPFARHLPTDPSNVSIMRRLDRLASAIYGFALVVVGCLITALLLYLVGSLMRYLGAQAGLPEWSSIAFIWTYYSLLALAAIDFLTAGAIRRSRFAWVRRAFYPIYLYVAWVGFARWYRPLYYVFFTRMNLRWFAPFVVVYLGLTVMVTQSTSDISIDGLPELPVGRTYEFLPSYAVTGPVAETGLVTRHVNYEDVRDFRSMVTYKLPSIESELLPRNQHSLRLTIPYWQQRLFEPGIARCCPELKPFLLSWWSDFDADSAGLADPTRRADVQALMQCFSERFVRIAINDSLLPPVAYRLTSVAHAAGLQPALRTYIPTDGLAPGPHRLFIRFERLVGKTDTARALVLTIPFYKE